MTKPRADQPSPQAPFDAAFCDLLPTLISSKRQVDGGRAQQLRARRAVLSQSGTFVGHRRYERGDDLRRLDWSAYARTGELFTKQLEEDDRRAVTVAIDLSASMLAGDPQRRVGALRLAAVVGGLALARLDGVCIVAPGANAPTQRFAGVAQLPLLVEHLRGLPVTDAAPAAVSALVLSSDAVGRVHWISDFAPPREFERPLRALRRRGAKVTGWLPVVPQDEAPPSGGYLQVVDPETGRSLRVPVDQELQAALRRQLVSLKRQQQRMFAEVGSPLLRWPFATRPLDAPDLADHLAIVAACAR
ncbi:MAG: DUF58 domain-containing protein [Planctomycetota bacterium]|nr:DUF58 domain-containing protein [Planctomycetota bacterium]MEC9048087.1 DUF58 domain-containing protein [Planctomycetota bacterium]